MDGRWCVDPDSCNRGSEFRKKVGSYKFCASCDLTEAVDIGTTDGHRSMCTACTTTKRFWVGEYCYRCDTAETPDVILDDEITSCTACPQQETKDGKCVLKQ